MRSKLFHISCWFPARATLSSAITSDAAKPAMFGNHHVVEGQDPRLWWKSNYCSTILCLNTFRVSLHPLPPPLSFSNSSLPPTPGSGPTAAGRWGDYKCDVPMRTLENLMQFIADNLIDEFDWVYWLGDLPAHNVWAQSREDQVGSFPEHRFS